MTKISLWRVISSNVKCAVCKNKSCKVRFLPERKRYTYVGGTRFVDSCKKDLERKMNRPLP